MNKVRKRILESIKPYADFWKHKDLIACCVCGEYFTYEDENGNEYFALVTLVKEYYSSYCITYDESKYTLTELIMNGKQEIPYASSDPDAEDCDFFLYPGQMRLFRIDKK